MAQVLLRCSRPACATSHSRLPAGSRCLVCGELLEFVYDLAGCSGAELRRLWASRGPGAIPAESGGVWRFRELLPAFDPRHRISLGEGSTPLIRSARADTGAGAGTLWLKQQGANPTGSFKDTGMAVVMAHALAEGARWVGCASTGNTAASMAAYAARAGLPAVVFVPEGAVAGPKLAQALDFGAMVIEVGSSFDQSFALLREVAERSSLYLVNSINPYRVEGQKTAAFEIIEQLGWRQPQFVVLPGGNLGNVSALGKGLSELVRLGLISALPRLVVVQARGAAPFAAMVSEGLSELRPVPSPQTRATAIRIGNPASWRRALRVLDASEGLVTTVTDLEIFAAKAALAAEGIGCEPASAAAVAGLRKLRSSGEIPADAEVVAVLTGHQLKDIESGSENGDPEGRSRRCEATAEAVLELLGSLEQA